MPKGAAGARNSLGAADVLSTLSTGGGSGITGTRDCETAPLLAAVASRCSWPPLGPPGGGGAKESSGAGPEAGSTEELEDDEPEGAGSSRLSCGSGPGASASGAALPYFASNRSRHALV